MTHSGIFTKLRSIAAVLLALLVGFGTTYSLVVSLRAAAAEISGTITIICRDQDNNAFPGIDWKLYSIGHRDSDGNLILDDAFAGSGIHTNAQPLDLAVTLQHYAEIHLTPDYTGTTNAFGTLRFTEVPEGTYLAVGAEFLDGDRKYYPTPCLVDVMETEENPTLQWNLQPKFTFHDFDESQVSYIVTKDWVDDWTDQNQRPSSITVDLYCNGRFVRSVELSQSNNWTYTWRGNIADKWQVLEQEVPPNYVVTYADNFSELTYLISNRYESSGSETTTTPETTTSAPTVTTTTAIYTETTARTTTPTSTAISGTVTPPAQGTDTAEGSETVGSAETTTTTASAGAAVTTTTSDTKIPYTGQLWWPVPCMGIGGLVCIGFGKRLRQKEE